MTFSEKLEKSELTVELVCSVGTSLNRTLESNECYAGMLCWQNVQQNFGKHRFSSWHVLLREFQKQSSRQSSPTFNVGLNVLTKQSSPMLFPNVHLIVLPLEHQMSC